MSTHRTYGWLVVTVCFLALLVVVLGHVARDRWCGPVLCKDTREAGW